MGKKGKKENIIVGLDIGTTKICAIVGEVNENGVEIIGIGTQPSRGMRKGVVINIDATVESIRKAVEEAELMAGAQITSVYCAIAGSHIQKKRLPGRVSRWMAPGRRYHGEWRQLDLNQ